MPTLTDRILIEASQAQMRARGATVARDFYDILFAAAPDLRALFPDDIASQAAKLDDTFAAVIEATDGGAAIRGRLAALGLRHAALGVTPAHYPPVAAALVDALARAAGPGWKPAHAHAWTALIGEVVEAMLSGAANDDDTA